MFATDAQILVPREMPWHSSTAIQWKSGRRRKRLGRRLMRDVRTLLPVMALAITFAVTLLAADMVTLNATPGTQQSPTVAAMQASLSLGD